MKEFLLTNTNVINNFTGPVGCVPRTHRLNSVIGDHALQVFKGIKCVCIMFLLFSITTCILFGITLTEPKIGYGQSKLKPGLSPEDGRDPFSLPPRVHLLSKSDTFSITKGSLSTREIKPSSSSIKVKAILISDQIRLASIDRYIVAVGDSIRDEKILEIKDDRVILGKGNNKRTLLLYQSPVQITVEDR